MPVRFRSTTPTIRLKVEYEFIKDKNEIVQADWQYSYDIGGFPMVIPEEALVREDMIGKPAHEAAVAWEYFMKPKK